VGLFDRCGLAVGAQARLCSSVNRPNVSVIAKRSSSSAISSHASLIGSSREPALGSHVSTRSFR
jgi:hypothetical protein